LNKASYAILFVVLAVILFLILSSGTSGKSNNPCGNSPGCHGSLYYQYLDILEGDSAIPSAIEVGETKTLSVVVENSGNTGRYSMLSGVSVTLTSKNGHFSVDSPSTYSIGDLPLGKETATFQITGISEGFDSLSITTRGENREHVILRFSFSDSYSNSMTVGHPEPTPTPTATTPAPSSTTNPTTPTPAPSSTPTPTSSPDTEPAPPPTSQLSIQLTSPAEGEQWMAGTVYSIKWNATGGTEPLTITLKYSTSSDNGPWTPIATDIPDNGLFMWTTPSTIATVYIRAVVTDSANAPQTTSTVRSVEINGSNAEAPVILIAATVIPVVAILTFLYKRRPKGNDSKSSKTPENPHVKLELKYSEGFEK
jgi:cell division septation protein DedD